MAAIARVTAKGQITISGEIRRLLGIREGDAVLFEVVGGEVRMVPLKRRKPTELVGLLPATRPFPGTDAVRQELQQRMATRWGMQEDPRG